MKQSTNKCVRWSTVTVYEFGVALGGSAVPRRGGPSIGLARRPQHVWSTTLEKVGRCGDLALTRPNTAIGDGEQKESAGCRLQQKVRGRRRVRWLKPLERITMLTKAGCSEKRIYRMMMESSNIAMSRRLCVSMQQQHTCKMTERINLSSLLHASLVVAPFGVPDAEKFTLLAYTSVVVGGICTVFFLSGTPEKVTVTKRQQGGSALAPSPVMAEIKGHGFGHFCEEMPASDVVSSPLRGRVGSS
ncbi:hypothetical protein PsorP6_006292 [Peronosclerospora sorghi]|uniref:Uncharacterized protein n=1 Tax=Peronosclerospora sorghi TaxID=230839 RepID=A0ACC0W2Q8_9STRA|nr:hypothetical protein PsorP6_006292 [Peronosclerospora sorghi]